MYIGRENKSIEIWKVQSWSQIVVIPGNKNCDIRRIHWLENNFAQKHENNDENLLCYTNKQNKLKKRRLLTTGLNGNVIEWSIFDKKTKSKYSQS